MKNKKWLIIVGVLILILLVLKDGCASDGLNARAALIVNGNKIADPDKEIRIYQRADKYYGWIPIFSVLQNFGCPVEWVNDETAIITINGLEYEYRYRDEGLFGRGTDNNYWTPEYGKTSYSFVRKGQDVYTSTASFSASMENLGVNIEINLDIDAKQITINSLD